MNVIQIPLKSFESTLHGLHNLLALTGSTEALARFIFMSSGTATLSQTKYGAVPEATTKLLAEDNDSGYAQSKLAAETIIDFAHELGYDARIYRVGQLVGHTVNAIWNEIGTFSLLLHAGPRGQQRIWIQIDDDCNQYADFQRLHRHVPRNH